MIRAAIYLRVSTDRQAQDDRTSIPEQRRLLTAIAERQGWDFDVFEEVATAGDGLGGLPVLTGVMGKITLGGYSKLLVYHLDRLSRAGVGEGERIKAILASAGCEIVTPGGKYDPRNESDDLSMDVQWLITKQEHRRIFHRTYQGAEARAKTGDGRLGHMVPFGYQVVYRPDGSSYVEVIPHEAAIIRRIYELYLSGCGAPAIALTLEQEGARGRQGKPVGVFQIWYWLANPRYAGLEFRRGQHTKWRYNKRKFATSTESVLSPSTVWPAIVSPEDWQHGRDIYGRRYKHHSRSRSPLSGILKCKSCGSTMTITAKGSKGAETWYRCHERMKKKTCKEPYIRSDEAHAAVYRWLERVLTEGFPEVKQESRDEERKSIEASLAEIQRAEDRLMNALLKGVLTDEQVARKNQELKAEREALMQRLGQIRPIKRQAIAVTPDVLKEMNPNSDLELFGRMVKSVLESVVLAPGRSRTYVDSCNRAKKRFSYRVIKATTVFGHEFSRYSK